MGVKGGGGFQKAKFLNQYEARLEFRLDWCGLNIFPWKGMDTGWNYAIYHTSMGGN